jgi:hypothetical protein
MSGDLLARLIAAGVGADLIAEVARLEARAAIAAEELQAREAAEAARREHVRAGNTERQQRRRARNGVSRDVTTVTRDNALPGVTPPLDKKNPQTPKRINPPLTPIEANASMPPAGAAPGGSEPIGNRAKRRASARCTSSRLSADWTPPPVTELPQPIQAIVHNWPAGAYDLTGLQFKNHWATEGRAMGAKRDWPKCWHNWLIREAPSILRAAKAGMRFDVIDNTGQRPIAERIAWFETNAVLMRNLGRKDTAESFEQSAAVLRAQGAA